MMLPKSWRRARTTGRRHPMGITHVAAEVYRPDGSGPRIAVTMLVDSGAIYSLLPADVWRPLALAPRRQVDFSLADGSRITRGVSECSFEIEGVAATSPVVLGESDEGPLLGAVTLETLGLVLSPLTRRLVPMRHVLAALPPAFEHAGR